MSVVEFASLLARRCIDCALGQIAFAGTTLIPRRRRAAQRGDCNAEIDDARGSATQTRDSTGVCTGRTGRRERETQRWRRPFAKIDSWESVVPGVVCNFGAGRPRNEIVSEFLSRYILLEVAGRFRENLSRLSSRALSQRP